MSGDEKLREEVKDYVRQGLERSKEDFVERVVTDMYEESRQKARQYLDEYLVFERIRPYFDVQAVDVSRKLLAALIPLHSLAPQNIDFYGPLMLVFTLALQIILQLQLMDLPIEEGSLVGFALFAVFVYWLVLCGGCYVIALANQAGRMAFIQMASITGYSFTAVNLLVAVLSLVNPLLAPSQPTLTILLAFSLYILIGASSAASLSLHLLGEARTPINLFVAGFAGLVHFLWLGSLSAYLGLLYI